MANKCFLSFHYKQDSWRVSQVRQIGAIENSLYWIRTNGKKSRKQAMMPSKMDRRQHERQRMPCRTCGREDCQPPLGQTRDKESPKDGLGVLAIHVHNLKDSDGNQSSKGSNPFTGLTVDGEAVTGKVYDPPYTTSTNVYDYIKSNIETWVSDAIKAR